jgi:hypothetical protein
MISLPSIRHCEMMPGTTNSVDASLTVQEFLGSGQICIQIWTILVHEYLILPVAQNVRTNELIRESSGAHPGPLTFPKDRESSGQRPFAPYQPHCEMIDSKVPTQTKKGERETRTRKGERRTRSIWASSTSRSVLDMRPSNPIPHNRTESNTSEPV